MATDLANLKFESPIESKFASALARNLRRDLAIRSQVAFRAPGISYRADQFIECPGQNVLIELDGRDFHDERIDRRRDVDFLVHGWVRTHFGFAGATWFLPSKN